MLHLLPRLAFRLPCRRCHHLTLSHRISPTPFPPTRQCLHTTPPRPNAAPKTTDRGPASKEDTQTDFSAMDMLSSAPVPTTAVDACMETGFALNSGLKVVGSGVLLIGGEAFSWKPEKLVNSKQQLEPDAEAWGVLDLVWPKPDLLILGTGARIVPPSVETRRRIAALGIRVEVQDTRNAAAQFNLLATERGVQQVAAALVPVGWGVRRA